MAERKAGRDEHGLLKQQRDFADNYVNDPGRNATAAYIAAGYKARGNSAEVNAHNLLRRPKLAAYVALKEAKTREKAEKSYDITQERVLSELAGIAYSDPADLYAPDGTLLPIHEIPERTRRAIASIEHGPNGMKIKLWSKTQGADMLAKHLNLYEKHQKAGLGEVAELMREIAARRSPDSNPVERAKANHAGKSGGK
jgi:phage terminase small subunit